MRVKIEKSEANGIAIAPPSKSIAHRLLIACALASGKSEVAGISDSEDMLATLDCIKALGVEVAKDGDVVHLNPNADKQKPNRKIADKNCESNAETNDKNNPECKAVFDCRESGSTLRFFIPVASVFFEKSEFVGSKRLLERGVDVYKNALGDNGVKVDSDSEKIIVSSSLRAGEYTLDGNVSSQYVSGLMFALPLLDGDSKIIVREPVESRAYIDMTIDVLKKAGIYIAEIERNVFYIKGAQRYRSGKYAVEGDWSNGAMLLAFDELGGRVDVVGLDENSVQGDKVCKDIFKKLDDKNVVVDLANCPDLAPIAFVAAAVKNGATFTGTRRLRIKESDRATAMAQELEKFGIVVDVHENDVVVHKNDIKTPCCDICGHNDHRIVMACSVLLSMTGGYIDGAEAVKKSFPNFFNTIGRLGVKYEVE